MLSRFESQIERSTAIRPWQNTRLGQQSRANPRKSRFQGQSFWAYPRPRLMTGASLGFAFPEFGIFLAQSSTDNADGSHERETAACKRGPR
jgi:hypothetical protein